MKETKETISEEDKEELVAEYLKSKDIDELLDEFSAESGKSKKEEEMFDRLY